MDDLILKSNAKINLGLDIISRRDDGFHEIRSIFQEIDWGDEIKFNRISRGIDFRTNISELSGISNLCYKAASLISAKYDGGIRIELKKKIPWGAGLGGGSSNAAAVLKGINQLYNLGLNEIELADMGATLGSDIPFFIYGRTAHVSGRGEVIVPIENKSPFRKVLIVLPGIHLSTKMMYEKTKKILTRQKKSFILYPSFAENLLNSGMSGLKNDFEEIAFEHHPELKDIKTALFDSGCEFAMMTGSGSAFFGLYQGKVKIVAELKEFRLIEANIIV